MHKKNHAARMRPHYFLSITTTVTAATATQQNAAKNPAPSTIIPARNGSTTTSFTASFDPQDLGIEHPEQLIDMNERFLVIDIDPERLTAPCPETDIPGKEQRFLHLDSNDILSPDLEHFLFGEFLYGSRVWYQRLSQRARP